MQIPTVQLITDPAQLPDLSSEAEIGLDVETHDPTLKTLGPGPRRDGYIIGLSVAASDRVIYVPVRHGTGHNLDPATIRDWVTTQVFRPGLRKVGHNLSYDLDHFQESDLVTCATVVHDGGPYECSYINELLLDERKEVKKNLEEVATRYLGLGKFEDELRAAAAKYNIKEKNIKNDMWKMAAEDVYQYGGLDSWLALTCAQLQREEINKQQLTKVHNLECQLFPVLMAMRHCGVRIDEEKLLESKDSIHNRITEIRLEIQSICGEDIAPWEAAQIANICDRLGLSYSRTYKTNVPSFTTEFLKASEEPFFQNLFKLRSLDKIVGTFLEGQLETYMIKGRIHPIFRPEGTITGRFSCEHPNTQFFPARHEEFATIVRGVFLPEEECEWFRADFSQVEYRLLVHFAYGTGAEEARKKYNDDATTDYHTFTQELVANFGLDLPRGPIKNLNFGLIYGQGINKTAAVLGMSKEKARAIQKKYHSAVPFAKQTMDEVSRAIAARGYVRTVNGRRRRFNTWEPKEWAMKYMNDERVLPLEHDEAARKWVAKRIERANTYKGLNACLQGSAAEITKKAMVELWKSGICDVIGVPHLTVHDELGCSVNFNDPKHLEAAREMKRIMETSTPLNVPLYVNCERGPSWGELEEVAL